MRTQRPLATCLGFALLAGCTSTVTTAAAPGSPSAAGLPRIGCTRELRGAFAPSTQAVNTLVSIDPGYTKCNYASPDKSAICPHASVTINTSPQAFTDFNRWVVETEQNAGAFDGPGHSPEQIDGIGVLADWVPATLTFETATQTRWIAVQLTCSGPGKPALGLAEALARAAIAAS